MSPGSRRHADEDPSAAKAEERAKDRPVTQPYRAGSLPPRTMNPNHSEPADPEVMPGDVATERRCNELWSSIAGPPYV